MKNRTEQEHLRAYTKLHQHLVDRGLKPCLQKLDNEASTALKRFMTQQGIDFQLVPPHVHRRNSAERAIQTFKNHFIAGLCSTDKAFPMHLWDRLLAQAATTLNLLRTSRINPGLSTYAPLEGAFDYNRTPMAPPGTRVVAHETPTQRRTWAPHGVDGWYIGRSPEHYRCYRIYVTTTAGERDVETVEFFPTQSKMPNTSSADAAIIAAQELIHALQNPAPATPFANMGNDRLQALRHLAQIFHSALPNAQPAAASPRVQVQPAPRVQAQPSPRVPTPTSLRVPAPTSPRVPTHPSPRVTRAQANQPRYPTRAHSANHVATMPPNVPLLPPAATNPIPHFAHAVIDPDTGFAQEYRHLIKNEQTKALWTRSFANELGRLAQGIDNRVKGTNTVVFIPIRNVPQGRKPTYGRIVVSIRPQKEEVERTRLTVGGNLIDYPGEVRTETADLTTTKLLLNSVVSTPDAKFMGIDVKNFYFNTPLDRYEYMRLPLDLIPQEIIDAYDLMPLVHQGFVYMEIQKGMYGLPQAGILANKLLAKRLAPFQYFPCPHTPGLWKHKTRPVMFSLVVDDFGVQYTGKENALHLVHALQTDYEVALDWKGQLYCGITLAWDYAARTVNLSMPGYIEKVLHKFQHPPPKQPQHAPSKWARPQYGVKVQLATPADTSQPLPPDDVKRLQKVVGTLLYYARAVDPTMLVALNGLASAQTKATSTTADALVHLLNYCTTYPDATIQYHASDMILHLHSDASYLSLPEARSRAGGHLFLSTKPSTKPTPNNGPVLNIVKVLRNVMSSAAEAETGALFHNCKEATILRNSLADMGYPQPPTPVQTDNSTASGIVNDTVKQQRSKAIDMRFYWVRDRIKQGHFHVFWAPGRDNLGDYFTKHHPPSHHWHIRPVYLHVPNATYQKSSKASPSILRGCVESPVIPKVTRRYHQVPQASHYRLPCTDRHNTMAHSQRTTRQ